MFLVYGPGLREWRVGRMNVLGRHQLPNTECMAVDLPRTTAAVFCLADR